MVAHALDAIPAQGLPEFTPDKSSKVSGGPPGDKAAAPATAREAAVATPAVPNGEAGPIRVVATRSPVHAAVPLAPPPLPEPAALGRSRSARRKRRRLWGIITAVLVVAAVGGLFAFWYQQNMKAARQQFFAAGGEAAKLRGRLASQISYRNDADGLTHNLAELDKVCESYAACRALPYGARYFPSIYETDFNEPQVIRKRFQQDMALVKYQDDDAESVARRVARARQELVRYAERYAPADYTIETPPPDDHWSGLDLAKVHHELYLLEEDLLNQLIKGEQGNLVLKLKLARQRLTEKDIEEYLAIAPTHLNTKRVFQRSLDKLMGHAVKLAPLLLSAAHRQYVSDFRQRRFLSKGSFFLGQGAPEIPASVADEIRKHIAQFKDLQIKVPEDQLDFENQCRAWRQIQWITEGGLEELPDEERAYFRESNLGGKDYLSFLKSMGGYLRFDGDG